MIANPGLTEKGPKYLLAESGVDNEIGIGAVQHDFTLAYGKRDSTSAQRSNAGSMFQIQMLEPNGISLFSRIEYASKQLRIGSHLEALYILELKLIGWSDDPIPRSTEIHKQEWITRCYGIQHSFSDNTSNYTMTMLETKEEVYSRLDFNISSEIIVDGATDLADFATKLQKELDEQSVQKTEASLGSLFPTEFDIQIHDDFKDYVFAADLAVESGDGQRMVSNTGGSGLKFVFPAGTTITNMLSQAIFHTEKFRQFPTSAGTFAGKEIKVDSRALTDLIKWISFDVNIEFLRFDPISKRYQRKLFFKLIPYIETRVIIDPASHTELTSRDSALQTLRLRKIFEKGLLKKRFDYSMTGKNTEVIDLSIALNHAYYVLQPLHSGVDTIMNQASVSNGDNGDSAADLDRLMKDVTDKIDEIKESIIDLGNLEPGISRRLQQEQRRLEIKKDALSTQILALRGGPPDFDENDTTIRTMTQADFVDGSSPSDPVSTKVTFGTQEINSLSTNGPESKETNGFAARLGAVELNLNSSSDMMTIDIVIRGDPYWLAKKDNKGVGEFDNGGPLYFLNANFPTYDVDSEFTATTSKDLNLAGLYRVYKVTASYNSGLFTMTLQSIRDLPSENSRIYEKLATGEITESQAAYYAETLALRRDGNTRFGTQ